MNNWKVIYYRTASGREPVVEFIKALSSRRNQEKIVWTITLLEKYGLQLGIPYLKKLRGTKNFWELKVNKYRIFLSPIFEKNFLLIHAIIKKTAKTPKRDLKLIKKRLKDFIRSLS